MKGESCRVKVKKELRRMLRKFFKDLSKGLTPTNVVRRFK